MNTWLLVAAAVGVCVFVVLVIGTRRPRTIQAELDRPRKPGPTRELGRPAQLYSSGSLAQTSLGTLLVAIQASRATGTLTLTRSDQVCSLHVLFGHLFHATCGGSEGEQAVQAALSWSDGTYTFDPGATLPTAETVTRPLDQVLAGGPSFPPPVSSPRPARSPESVDWAGLLNKMQQQADAALGDRSRKVKEILGAAQPGRESFIQAIDRIANTSIMFVDPLRLNTLAGQMRRMLDEAFDPEATLPKAETVTRPLDQVLAGGPSFPPPVSSPRSPESVDWAGLLNKMQQQADAALGDRSRKVKEILGAAQPGRESFIEAIDRIANTSVMFVDPLRLTTLAGQMRRMLDEATV